ncbi:MAG: PAS domain S-box protein [Bacteroidetes bacterium]|nr:PAS domain S-box protein [Bacteroidota bacterium]
MLKSIKFTLKNLAGISKTKMNLLGRKPQRLQFQLTIKLALFFISISVIIHLYLTNKFEDEAMEIFQYKSKVITSYLEQVPQPLFLTDIKRTRVQELMTSNKVAYVVLVDINGTVTDAINLDYAEDELYIKSSNSNEAGLDDTVSRVVLPIFVNKVKIGEAYIGFNSTVITNSIKNKSRLITLFSISIFLIGILFTYFLSTLPFKPIRNIISAIEASDDDEARVVLKKIKNNELGILARKIDTILKEAENSSNQIEKLNRELQQASRWKIVELGFETDQRKKAEVSRRTSEEQFKLLFENAPIGMVIISTEGIITNVNEAFCKNVGYEMDEILGLSIDSLFDKKSSFVKESGNLLKELSSLDSEYSLIKKDGNKIDAVVKSNTLFDENNKPAGYMMQLLDITDIKNVQNELITALNKATESDKLKSAFLAQMSHEIRTPLNVILTAVPLIADDIDSKDEDTKTILYSMGSAGRRLQRTIDMILSMSAMQSGNYQPKFELFNIVEEIKSLTEEFSSLAEEKGLILKFETTASISEIIADKYTVNQIFQNLIENAIKYTKRGSIKISVKNINEHKTIVNVQDSGIGISIAYRSKMFSPFSQEDFGQKRNYEGIGLGLALVKEYVDINHATITVESVKHQGSTFSVTFDKMANLQFLENKS